MYSNSEVGLGLLDFSIGLSRDCSSCLSLRVCIRNFVCVREVMVMVWHAVLSPSPCFYRVLPVRQRKELGNSSRVFMVIGVEVAQHAALANLFS